MAPGRVTTLGLNFDDGEVEGGIGDVGAGAGVPIGNLGDLGRVEQLQFVEYRFDEGPFFCEFCLIHVSVQIDDVIF